MMHYRKGENIEQELKKEDLPFDDCLSKLPQKDFLWMHVRGGTKVHNVINYAKNALDKGEYRTVVWSGSGGGVVKTVSCAEIIKRSYPLHQLTRMDQITIEEHWEPQMDGLEPIVAKRKVPSLHILMTLDPIDESITDVQKPNTTTEYWRGWNGSAQQQKNLRNPGQRHEGRMQQQQRHQRPKQPRQGKSINSAEGQRDDGQSGEQRERSQRTQNPNRNRGGQRKPRNENNAEQQQTQPLHDTPQRSSQQQQTNEDGSQRQQQSQRHRRSKPKQKQQQHQLTEHQSSPQAMQVEVTSTSSTSSNAKPVAAVETMES